ncbi:MAG: flagellar hook-length control protein FliK [Qingshengfaniella sp.]
MVEPLIDPTLEGHDVMRALLTADTPVDPEAGQETDLQHDTDMPGVMAPVATVAAQTAVPALPAVETPQNPEAKGGGLIAAAPPANTPALDPAVRPESTVAMSDAPSPQTGPRAEQILPAMPKQGLSPSRAGAEDTDTPQDWDTDSPAPTETKPGRATAEASLPSTTGTKPMADSWNGMPPKDQAIDTSGSQPTSVEADPVVQSAQRSDHASDMRAAGLRADLQRPADFARVVMPQLVEHVRPGGPREIEMSLNPAELGRIRMSIAMRDDGVTISVISERPETQDLLRRHAAMLEQEFQSLGYTDVNVGFANSGQQPFESDPDTGDTRFLVTDAEQPVPAGPQRNASGRLDLRL